MNEMNLFYQHYKGGIYQTIGIARHTETNEKLMIYQNGVGKIFARPLDMFNQDVDVDGEIVPRFKPLWGC